MRGLCQDHPFADGNKRTAYEAARLFLRLNGQTMSVEVSVGVAFMVAVAQDQLDLEGIATWVRQATQKDEKEQR